MDNMTTFDVTIPFDGAIVMLNRWWNCEGLVINPRKALFYKQFSPQCYTNIGIAKMVSAKRPNTCLVFIPIAYCPFDFSEH